MNIWWWCATLDLLAEIKFLLLVNRGGKGN